MDRTSRLHFFSGNPKSKIQNPKWPGLFAIILTLAGFAVAQAAQKELQKLTVGYTPISGAAIPLFIRAGRENFSKIWLRCRRYLHGRLAADQFGDSRRGISRSATPAAARSFRAVSAAAI